MTAGLQTSPCGTQMFPRRMSAGQFPKLAQLVRLPTKPEWQKKVREQYDDSTANHLLEIKLHHVAEF